MNPLGVVLALVVGLVLGLLGGGGSILALPVFLYVFHEPTKPAIAMSLAVVGLSAFVGFLTHWRQGTVRLGVALPFGACAMIAAFATARLTHFVPPAVQLALFAVFAFAAAFFMLRDATRDRRAREGPVPNEARRARPFGWMLGVEALGVGTLTSLIGAGGGFVIVPALVLLGGIPVREAVGSSLLIITMNALSGFAGYVGTVPVDWPLVTTFTGVAAVGAVAGTRFNRRVPQARIKQGFALVIIVLGGYLVVRKLTGG